MLRRSLILTLILTVVAVAQTNTATLLGTVTDATGAVVAGSNITITNVETKTTRTAASNQVGNWEAPLLPVGIYTVAAESAGFKRVERSGILLAAGDRIKLDITLEVGEIAERVTVNEAAPLVVSQTAERGVTIASNQIANLPLNGRNITNLIALEPGVVVGGQINGAITFNGLPYQGTTINIDGTDAANPDRPTTTNFGGQTRMTLLSQDFVHEFKTTQGVYSADIGRATGGSINVITKSGTNQLHGTAYEFVRNDKFDARNFFAARKDPLRLNEFGATVGGPVIHDKLFFFAGWEGVRERRGQQITGTVPTQLLRDEMLRNTPAFRQLLDLVAPPTEALPGEIYRGFHRRSDVRRDREDIFLGRFDFQPTPKDTFFARYSIFDARVVQPDLMPTNGRTFPSQDRTATLSWSRVLTARVFNEFRLGANKQDLPRAHGAFIPGQIGTLNGFLGTSDIEFLRANGGSWTVLDNLTYNAGRHSLKAGFEVRRYHYGRGNSQVPIYRFDSVQDLINNTPQSINVTTNLEILVSRNQTTEAGFYLQDDLRLRPNLTLNLGLRYEYYSPASERDGRLYNVVDSPYGPFRNKGEPAWEPDSNNFAPRFGLSWDLDGHSRNVVRMGFGMFYNDNMLRHVSLLLNPPDRPLTVILDRRDFPTIRYPVDVRSVDPARFGAPVTRTLEDAHHRASYSEQWSIDLQREIVKDWAVTLGYVGNRGVKLQQIQFLNQIQANGQRPYPSIGQIRYDANNGSSVYHALQASLRKRFSHGFLFNTHYTFGKALTYGGSEEQINDIQDANDIRSSRSRTTLSLSHLLNINYGWDLPLDRLRLPKLLARGWRVNGITSVRSGFPLNVNSGRDNFGSGQPLGQRPSYIGGDIRAGTDDYRTSNLHNYLNRAAFVANGRGQYGNLGGYVLTGPGAYTWDFSVFKNTAIREKATVQFRAEFFNIFNRANFSNPSTAQNAGTFGRITGAGAARELQFGLKLLY